MSDMFSGSDTAQAEKPETLKPDALVERMKLLNPDLAGKMSDKRLAAIVRGTVQALAAEVNARDEGRLRIPGLGAINIRQVERERNGEMVHVKRVTLRPARPKG